MEKVDSFVRMSTPDCPMAVSYYSPLRIIEEPYYPHLSQGLLITVMQQGKADIYTNGSQKIITAGDILIIPPRQLYTFRTMTMDTRYILLSILKPMVELPEQHFFRRDFIEPLFQGQLKVPELIRPGDPLHAPLSATLQPLDRKKEGSADYTAQLFAAVISFCACLMPHCTMLSSKEQTESDGQSTVIACLDYIKNHYAEKVTLQQIADHVHLHPNYLCALFKGHTGRTVFEYLERFRLRQAARMLRSTTLPVSQIAEACGFNSTSFFSRKYRALLGYSPLQYRKHHASTVQQDDFIGNE